MKYILISGFLCLALLTGCKKDSPMEIKSTKPTNLRVLSISYDSVMIQWNDNSTNETGFIIEKSLNGTSFSVAKQVGGNVTSTSVPGQYSAPINYYFRVRALRNNDTLGTSNRARLYYEDALYIAGAFGVYKWNETTLSRIASVTGSGTVGAYALSKFRSSLIIGGSFQKIGGTSANGIAEWDGLRLFSLGAGVVKNNSTSSVVALALGSTSLYVGGDFTTAGGVTANFVAQWNDSLWSPVGTDLNVSVRALTRVSSVLYACETYGVYKFTNNVWSQLGTDFDFTLITTGTAGGTLYAGGNFLNNNSVSMNHIAKWNGSNWAAVGAGVNGTVRAIGTYNGGLLIGGDFTKSNETITQHLALWNGSSWAPFANGVTGNSGVTVFSLCTYNGNLYVGGNFNLADNESAYNIAKWDGSGWSRVGSGFNTPVYAMAEYDSWVQEILP